MNDDVEILLRLCEEQWNHIRHLESQRATFTNLVLIVTAAILGFLVQQGLSKDALALTILLASIGISGAIASSKFTERYHFHRNKSLHWLMRINELNPNTKFLELDKVATEEHYARFPHMSKLHVHSLWIALHALIALLGIIFTVIIIIR